jgi:GT2 family glycosyltransferase
MTTEKKTFNPVVNVKPVAEKLIDIIVPFCGCYDSVNQVIKSIFMHSPKIINKLILVDNGSENKEFAIMYSEHPKIKVVRSETNLGFGGSVNLGMKNAEKTIVVVMHSDSYLTDKNSLSNLYKDFVSMRNQNVAMMTSISDNPQVNEKLLQRKSAAEEDPKLVNNNFIPMYCCIIDVAAWHNCQGVPEFPLAWFEDEAFCYKLNRLKYNIAVSYKSFVNHKGSLTVKNLIIKDKKNIEIMKSNIELLNKIRR